MEKLEERLEELEDILVVDPRPETSQEIHRLRREMVFLRADPCGICGSCSAAWKEQIPRLSERACVSI